MSGKTTLFAPEWSGNLIGTLILPVFGDYRLGVKAIGIFSSKFQTFSAIDPRTVQPGYARLDGRISLDSPDGRWGFDIIAKNLTSTTIRTFSFYQPTSPGSLYQDRVQYRNIAFQLRYNF